jgi:hypothetical protein
MSTPKPPGHTCIAIDRTQKHLRRIRHLCRGDVEIEGIVSQALTELETVRKENTAMREAYVCALSEKKK